MKVTLSTEYATPFFENPEYQAISLEAKASLEKVKDFHSRGVAPLGWYSLPYDYDKEEFSKIKECAARIRKMCDVFIVVGVGGSYLGASAALDFLHGIHRNAMKKSGPAIYFAGTDADCDNICDLVRLCEGKDFCINVISKSGTTTEPAIAFRIFRDLAEKKYGKEEAGKRIFVTTDRENKHSTLKEFSDLSGYESFTFPRNIGGRYSVLTPVGLLPIAVSGADIDAMIEGASVAAKEFETLDVEKNICMQYAILRNLFYRKGKKIEMFVFYSSSMQSYGEWLKQLFGESEGKNGQGIFPASMVNSRDLHSIGQYVQEGERTLFETVFQIREPQKSYVIPVTGNNVDGLQYLEGMSLDFVNKNVFRGATLAHCKGGVPSIVIEFERRDEKNFGYLVYFFELACAISGYILGVNPFDQPGVEAYKINMFRFLGKPGYEKI